MIQQEGIFTSLIDAVPDVAIRGTVAHALIGQANQSLTSFGERMEMKSSYI